MAVCRRVAHSPLAPGTVSAAQVVPPHIKRPDYITAQPRDILFEKEFGRGVREIHDEEVGFEVFIYAQH
jgi:hypothetical protein